MRTLKQMPNDWKRWLATMRLPESEKCTDQLELYENPNARCCLGHAEWTLEREKRRVDGITYSVSYGTVKMIIGRDSSREPNVFHLTDTLAERLNLTVVGAFRKPISAKGWENGKFFSCTTLAQLNDASNLSTQQIADIIEREWLRDNFKTFKEDKQFEPKPWKNATNSS